MLEDDLRYRFEKYGKIMDVYVPRDKENNRPRGFGFVTFYEHRDADDAVRALDGYVVNNSSGVSSLSRESAVQTFFFFKTVRCLIE